MCLVGSTLTTWAESSPTIPYIRTYPGRCHRVNIIALETDYTHRSMQAMTMVTNVRSFPNSEKTGQMKNHWMLVIMVVQCIAKKQRPNQTPFWFFWIWSQWKVFSFFCPGLSHSYIGKRKEDNASLPVYYIPHSYDHRRAQDEYRASL